MVAGADHIHLSDCTCHLKLVFPIREITSLSLFSEPDDGRDVSADANLQTIFTFLIATATLN